MRLKDISDESISYVRASAWFLLTSEHSEQNLVVEMLDAALKQLDWKVKNARHVSTKLNQWIKVTFIVDLTLNSTNNPDNYVRIYAANGSSEPVFVDDICVEFE